VVVITREGKLSAGDRTVNGNVMCHRNLRVKQSWRQLLRRFICCLDLGRKSCVLMKLYWPSLRYCAYVVTRNRMGRSVTFLSRILKDVANPAVTSARVLGVDEHTALLLNVNNGDVSIVGVGTAYVCSSDHNAAVCKEDTPLTFQGKY
jgi:hypothetical protein